MDVLRALRALKSVSVLTGCLCALSAAPAAGAPSESEVKAAYLFNFARYLTWPAGAFAGAKDPIRICVLRNEPFRSVLATAVAGKRVADRPVVAEKRDSLQRVGDCHVLYSSAADAATVAFLAAHSVFAVSDSEDFTTDGGTANFVLAGNKVRFAINPGAVERAGLQVSSRLLRLAKIVE